MAYHFFLLLCLVAGVTIATPPNIVFMMVDDLGYGDVGFRDPSISTPNIDEISSEGVRLEQHYVLPTCGPSRASFLTGRYQTSNGMYSNLEKTMPAGLTRDLPLLPEKLQEAGYATHLVGKWHMGHHRSEYLPTSRGFDSFLGILPGASGHFTHRSCAKIEGELVCGNSMYVNATPSTQYTWMYSTEVYGQRAVDLIRTHGQTHNQKPIFLYLAFTAPHTPLEAPEGSTDRYSDVTDENRRTYKAMVTEFDKWLGLIKEELENQNMWQNTVLVFTSDNGGHSNNGATNWPLRGGKGFFYEGGVRAASFVASPLIQKPQRVSSSFMHITDWFPTFLGLAGAPFSGTTDGHDQWATISMNASSPRTSALLGLYPSGSLSVADSSYRCNNRLKAAYRSSDYKVITGSSGFNSRVPSPESGFTDTTTEQPRRSIRLYDVVTDPYEEHNLARMRTHRRTLRNICHEMNKLLSTAVDVKTYESDPNSRPTAENDNSWGPWLDA